MLDRAVYHIQSLGDFAEHQSVLAVFHPPGRIQYGGPEQQPGCKERRRG